MKKPIRGFTLIELIIVIIIIGIIAANSSQLIAQGFSSYTNHRSVITVEKEVQFVTTQIAQDLHQLISSNDLTDLSETTLSIFMPNGDKIAYAVKNGNLMRNSLLLSEAVSAAQFSYYNSNMQPISDPQNNRSSVKAIAIQLQTDYHNIRFSRKILLYLWN